MLLGNVLLPPPTGKTNQPSTRKSSKKCFYSNYRNTEERKGLPMPWNWKKVKILPDADRYFQVGSSMKEGDKIKMLLFLIQNVDMFGWSPYEVLGVGT